MKIKKLLLPLLLLVPFIFAFTACGSQEDYETNCGGPPVYGSEIDEFIANYNRFHMVDNQIIVTLTEEATFKNIFHDYTAEDFIGIDVIDVDELDGATSDSTGLTHKIRQYLLEDPSGNTIPEYHKHYKRFFCITLAKKDEDNVLRAVYILRQRADILYAEPNSYGNAGGTTETDYDNKQVSKIETRLYNGEGFVGYRMRLFDFESGTVTDKAVISESDFNYLLQLYIDYPIGYPEYDSTEQYREYLLSNYNVSVPVAEFSQEDGNEFISAAKSFGLCKWRESYIDEFICDATHEYIITTFTDGTTKTTHCYCEYPEGFDKVKEAFNDYFGVSYWCNLRLK